MESGDCPGQDVSAQLLGIVGFDVNAAFDARADKKGIDPEEFPHCLFKNGIEKRHDAGDDYSFDILGIKFIKIKNVHQLNHDFAGSLLHVRSHREFRYQLASVIDCEENIRVPDIYAKQHD